MQTREEVLTVRSGRGATIGVVTELMNVHATLRVGIVASDVVRDGGRRGLVGLLELYGPRDLGVSPNNCDYEVQEYIVSRKSLRS